MAINKNAGNAVSSSGNFAGQMGSSRMEVIAQTIETGEVRGGLITFIVVNMAGRGWTESVSAKASLCV